jgi:F-type H+-transporting ATPase subunit gamma
LCGGFNSSIVRAARAKIQILLGEGKTVKVMSVGKKGTDALKRNYSQYFVDSVDMSGIKKLTFAHAHPVSDSINAMFEAGDFDVCTIFYNKFVTVMEQVVTEQQLVPLPMQEPDDAASAEASDLAYEFEPEEDEILAELLPRNMAVQIYRALLENAASEQGARMSAMDNATRNAGDMIDKLNIVYNRTRQAKITSELIEIISGAEAV